jgi:hypothetical protein
LTTSAKRIGESPLATAGKGGDCSNTAVNLWKLTFLQANFVDNFTIFPPVLFPAQWIKQNKYSPTIYHINLCTAINDKIAIIKVLHYLHDNNLFPLVSLTMEK